MKDVVKKYSNGEVTIVWKSGLCIHSAMCFKGLAEVFNPQKRPWITPEGASTEKIVQQIKKCPSGALSYYLNRDAGDGEVEIDAETIVEPMINGPLMVYGNVNVKDSHGNITKKIMSQPFVGVEDHKTNPSVTEPIKK